MNETVAEVYVTMLSKKLNRETESRLFEANWLLVDLGIPMTIEIDGMEWEDWKKWTEE